MTARAMSQQSRPICVLTVDDHPLLREGIAAMIADEPDMVLVGEAANGREAVEQFRAHRPDVTLMDLQLPQMTGLEAMAEIRAEFPEARIIVLTTYTGDVRVVRALQARASGYQLKSTLGKEHGMQDALSPRRSAFSS
jgi:DNA-binding NarL/FixJ family response regulator